MMGRPDGYDSGLRCPHCAYNLTGLSDDRCPECGRTFDRQALLRDIQRDVTPWEAGPGMSTFWMTWKMAIVNPDAVAESQLRPHSSTRAWLYSLTCYALASAILAGPVFLTYSGVGGFRGLRMIVATSVAIMCGAVFAETVMAALMTAVVWTPTPRRSGYRLWRGFTHYMSGYVVVSAFFAAVAMLAPFIADAAAAASTRVTQKLAFGVAPGFGGMNALWWIGAVGGMGDRRTPPMTGVGHLATLVVGLAAVGAGGLSLAATSGLLERIGCRGRGFGSRTPFGRGFTPPSRWATMREASKVPRDRQARRSKPRIMPRIAQIVGVLLLVSGCAPDRSTGVGQSAMKPPNESKTAAGGPDSRVAQAPAEPAPPEAPPPTNRRLLLEELERHDERDRPASNERRPLLDVAPAAVPYRPKRPVNSWMIFREAYKPLKDATCKAEWTGGNRLEVDTENINRITLDLTRLPAGAARRGPWNLQIDGQGIEITGRRGRIMDLVRSRNGRWTVDRKTLRKRE